ncbi:zona pellucida sperm-binding protein 4-like isoform X2 [Brienomyrus brachyistius]|uniref:zona pellucida sperm-binding protein 4-like isoform X2 n=1 Tax=Brienomyrus brachyistius TaxID=42636 RepID=UPI0020B2AD1B|nr:zona pellucida sperm-binding protein 4-like isoform X2 [Brienomyrus brachyistius]
MAKSRCIQQLWAHASILLAVLAVSFAQKTAVKNFVSASAKCQVYERVPCGDPAFGQAACEAINCCFDGQQCYYGNAVTVQCTRDGQFVVVVAKDSTVPQLDVASVSLLGGNAAPCLPVATTNAFAIYTFPVTACGTVVKVDGDYVVYENRMTSSYEVGVGPLGSITRDSLYELLFQCRYWGAEVASLVAAVNTVPPPLPVAAPGPLRVELRLANGQCYTKGCDEGAAAYTSYYQDSDYPVTKVLRQPVYVEVRILNRTDPNLVLVLENCWATPGLDPLSLPQWSLLVDGCPYQGDKYQTTLVPVDASSGLPFPTHYKRFIVKMFTFVDPASQRRYQGKGFIHCSVAVCRPSATDSCEQRCFRKGRDVAAAHKSSSPDTAVVSSGEMHLVAPRVGHMAGRW